jgi:ankyrin repeat protein
VLKANGLIRGSAAPRYPLSQVVRYLLDKGAHPTVVDCYGDTPLGHAILYMYVPTSLHHVQICVEALS